MHSLMGRNVEPYWPIDASSLLASASRARSRSALTLRCARCQFNGGVLSGLDVRGSLKGEDLEDQLLEIEIGPQGAVSLGRRRCCQ
jgi:hypothetical protein